MELITAEQLSALYDNPDWPISIHDFYGNYVPPTHTKKRNLLDIIVHHKYKFVCDSNSSWKTLSSDPENRSKIFILSASTLDEQRDFYNNLFSEKINLSFGNIFIVLILPNNMRGIAIEHYTEKLLKIRKLEGLEQMSQERLKSKREMSPETRQAEGDVMNSVAIDKQIILKTLNGLDLDQIGQNQTAAMEEANKLKASLLEKIQKNKFKCFKNYALCNEIAYTCYAALLLELDKVGSKTRKEFSKEKRNTFGDLIVFRDAIWLNASILSGDNAIRRMADYINLSKVKVVESI